MRQVLADALVILAVALVAVGAWMIYPPAAFIVAGVGLGAFAIRMGTAE